MSGMKVVFGRGDETPPTLFAGQAWMDAAEAWAAERGAKVAQWRVDQCFRVGAHWYRIRWAEGPPGEWGSWTVAPMDP